MRVKKIESIVDNYSGTEIKRRKLILEIQSLHKSGASIREIARITGKERKTVKKYIDGDPDILCRSNKRSQLASCTDDIVKSIKDGLTASDISRQLQEQGYQFKTLLIKLKSEFCKAKF